MMSGPTRLFALLATLAPTLTAGLVASGVKGKSGLAHASAIAVSATRHDVRSVSMGLTPPAPGPSAHSALEDAEWPLLRQLRQAIFDYELIAPGDKIAVAVSGGKDSSTLAYLLKRLKERRLLPFNDWEFLTIHLDQVQPGHDPSSLASWLQSLDVDFHLLTEDTYSVVKEKTRAGASYCSLCSRLRRGILYTAALERGCNRLALGHHRDDALETLLLNMAHQGQTKALPARYVAARGIDVIRPLIYTAEQDIGAFARANGFPILPCNLCGSTPDGEPGQRQQMKLLLAALDGVGDGAARANMLRALTDVRPTHLLDRELRAACGLDAASGALRHERGRTVAHCAPGEVATEKVATEKVATEKVATVNDEAAEEASEVVSVPAHRGTQRAPAAGSADARRSRFKPTSGPPLVCAPSVAAYEAAVAQLVRGGDSVLEVGCQLGRTTRLLAEHVAGGQAGESGHVLGVDIERELHGKSGKSATYRAHATAAGAGFDPATVDLVLLDPWDTPALLEATGGRPVDVLLIDINSLVGNDLSFSALALARQLARCLPSLRTILLKSRSLAKLERQLCLPAAYAAEQTAAVPTGWLPRILPAVGVKEYRATALTWLNRHPASSVLEIGCHLGTSTALLHSASAGSGGRAVGVDVSRSIVERARAMHGPSGATFAVADAWDGAGLRAVWTDSLVDAERGPALICLDVGGVSSAQGELDALSLVRMLMSTFGDTVEAIVVKSHCLRSTARTLQPVDWPARRTKEHAAQEQASNERASEERAADAGSRAAGYRVQGAGSRAAAAHAQQLPGSDVVTRAKLRTALSARHAGVAIVLENCRKENAALVARTAECLGVGELHLVFTPEQVVATRGFGGMSGEARAAWLARLSKSATDWLTIDQHDSIEECAAALRARGCETLVATTPQIEGALSLYSTAAEDSQWASRRVALMFGSEGSGLSARAIELADVRLSVPQAGMTQSLNVAACASLVLGETLRLRAASGVAPPPRLSEAEQRDLEAKFMPGEGEKPVRRHNKAVSKTVMRQSEQAIEQALET